MADYGLAVEDLKEEEEKLMKRNYFMYSDGVMRLQPGNWILPTNFNKYSHLLSNFDVKPSDIFVTTFPKSGTTWVQEIIWNLLHNPDLDNPKSDSSLDARCPNFEADMFIATTNAPPPDPNGEPAQLFKKLCPGQHYLDGILLHLATFIPSPRMFKSHLPICLLPPKTLNTCKVFYVARDPRDVLSSLYHYIRLQVLWGFKGTLDEYLEDVFNDRVPFGPYWNHMKEAWKRKDDPNLCIVFYEDLKNDIVSEIKKIDKFLGTNRTDEQIQNIVHHASFSQMKERSKKNPPTSNDNKYFNAEVQEKEGGFFRKGEIGDWKNRFTPEQVQKINAWMTKNLPQFGDDFKYKIEDL